MGLRRNRIVGFSTFTGGLACLWLGWSFVFGGIEPSQAQVADQQSANETTKETTKERASDPAQGTVPAATVDLDVAAAGEASENPLDEVLADWKKPRFVFFVTGRQHGYMEPCGCTGLEKAKGGLTRRYTMLRLARDRGWSIIPVDVGNQVRRFGKQADIKFQRTADILKKMNYAAVAFGPDDLRLSLDGLLAPVHEASNFVVANVSLLDLNRRYRVIQSDGVRIGLTGILGKGEQKKINRSADVVLTDPSDGIKMALGKFKAAKTKFNVLLANASLDETRELVKAFPNSFDLVVTAGGAGEPTMEPEVIPGSKTKIIQTGTKGMYVGLVGVFGDQTQDIRYLRTTLDKRYEDSKEVLEIFADYQTQLEIQGLEGLGVKPIKHPSGNRFVGHETCADCHTTAAEIFEKTPHHHATKSLITPPNSRGTIARHFDPECLSCHVTGWSPKKYLPYESGYLNVSQTSVHANGCENCHGPGSAHVDAEGGGVSDAEVKKRRAEMRITVKEAKESKCYDCHDIDNSPDFDFDSYWEKVKHKGTD